MTWPVIAELRTPSRAACTGLLGFLLINFEIFNKFSVIGKPAQSKLSVHDRTYHFSNLDKRPSVVLTPQCVMLAYNRINDQVSDAAKRKLKTEW